MTVRRSLWTSLALMLALMALPNIAEAAPVPPCSQEAGPAGCIDLTLSPETVLADVYVDGVAVMGQVNTARITVAPGVPHLIELKNVVEPIAGFGDIFVYQEVAQSEINVAEGYVRALTFRPQRTYLKGYVDLTCDIRSWEAGQEVACQPYFDDVPIPGIAPGDTAEFALPTGEHTLRVDLVGGHASLWTPPTSAYPLTLIGGRTSTLRASFDRKGELQLGLSIPDIVGDFYVDDVPVAGQVPSWSTFVEPGAHTISVRNLVDPAANGVYRYEDVTVQTWVAANQSRPVMLYPQKAYLMGFGTLTCNIRGLEEGQDARCHVLINGQDVGTVEAGADATYTLPPGDHLVTVRVVGGHASLWTPEFQELPLSIIAGRTRTGVASFDRKGELQLGLSIPDIVGDFYVDEVLVAAQVPSWSTFVAPGAHTVAVRNLVDPAANGVYHYEDAAAQSWVAANQSRPVTLYPQKIYLMGFGTFNCRIRGIEAGQDARCHVLVDGQDAGTVEANQEGNYTLPPGDHTLTVRLVGNDAGLWVPESQDLVLSILAGRTRALSANSTLKPAPKPAVVSAPAPISRGGFELGGHIVQGFQASDAMHYAGMNWAKVQARYPDDTSGIIAAAHAHGFRIQVSALGSAEMVLQPGFEGAFANWVAGIAGAGADAIEVWNEPNLPREWAAGSINPGAYASLLCQAYGAIKRTNPGTMVISAAPAPTGYFGGCHGNGCDDIPWLQGLYNAGGARCMDYIGAHHNAGATAPGATTGHPADGGDHHHSWYFLPQTRIYYQIFGGARQLFYTELGYVSPEGYPPIPETFWWGGGTSVGQQAQWLSEVVSLSAQTGMVRAVIVWNVDANCYGICGGVGDPQAGYAILRPDGSCPACESLHALLGTR